MFAGVTAFCTAFSHKFCSAATSQSGFPTSGVSGYSRMEVQRAIVNSEFRISMSREGQSRTNSRRVESSQSAAHSASPKLSNVDICWETVQSFAPCRVSNLRLESGSNDCDRFRPPTNSFCEVVQLFLPFFARSILCGSGWILAPTCRLTL